MKFFIVILALIVIDDYVGQATADTQLPVTVDNMVSPTNDVLRGIHANTGNKVLFLTNVDQGDLTYSMELTVNGEPADSSEQIDSQDFCENTLQAQILRDALLPEGQTSCPVKKGSYNTDNVYNATMSDSEAAKLKCGQYNAICTVQSAGGNTVLQAQLTFDLDKNQNNCDE